MNLLKYVFFVGLLCMMPLSDNASKTNLAEEAGSAKTAWIEAELNEESQTNRMYLNTQAWNYHNNNNGAYFQSILSQTTWHEGLYYNTIYIYGQSAKGNQPSATYITNFKIWLVTGTGYDQLLYQDKYLLINYGETRPVTNVYCTAPNAMYYITWDNCSPF